MAHFAILDDDNVVTNVVVIDNEVLDGASGLDNEQLGIDFCTELWGPGNYKQTSYNGNFRKNFAGIGNIYDPDRDAFMSSSPGEGWSLNEETCNWVAPPGYAPWTNKGD